MPSNETAKTKSARKRILRILLPLLLVGLIVYISAVSSKRTNTSTGDAIHTMRVAGQGTDPTYHLEVVTTPEDQEKGLGDTGHLDKDRGMIFVYDYAAEQCFWMKDMHYALDIIWVNTEKRVVHVEKQIAPESYPKTFCAYAQYVIELNAGEAERSGIDRGKVLTF